MFYYTFTTFDCNFIPRNAEICKVSSETKNVGKAHKYRLNRHLPTYEKIIKNLYSFLCINTSISSLGRGLSTPYSQKRSYAMQNNLLACGTGRLLRWRGMKSADRRFLLCCTV